VAVLLALVLAACGSNGSDGGASSGGQADVPSEFTDLPKPAAAVADGTATEAGGTWSQSFAVEGLDPAGVMSFYESELPGAGWEVTSPTAQTGASGYSATYSSSESGTLVVTASQLEAEGGGTRAQLNLQLTPAS
jgi:hypothetical protein